MTTSTDLLATKIKSSFLLISGYDFNITTGKDIDLSNEYITIPVDKGDETLVLSLSFKHVVKVDFLDNSEDKGAGLVLHINNFMALKLQQCLDEGGTKLMDFRTPYSENKLIVLDITNAETKNMNKIRNILSKAGLYHHSYVVQQMSKKRRVNLTPHFLTIITHAQWVAMFGLIGQDVIRYTKHHEWIIPVQLPITNGGSASSAAEHNYGKRRCNEVQLAENQYVYNAAPSPSVAFQFCPTQQKSLIRIVTVQPANAPPQLIQIPQQLQTASLPLQSMPTQSLQNMQIQSPAIKTKIPSTPQSSNAAQQQNLEVQIDYQECEVKASSSTAKQPNDIILSYPPNTRDSCPVLHEWVLQNTQIESSAIKTKTPRTPKTSNASKHKQNPEVHSIDDEECEVKASPSTAKQPNDFVLSYPPNTRDSCPVLYKDLRYLAIDVMLNDTIIDFYLKYIHHSLVPEEKRSKIHIFSTFFFGRLIKPPPHGKPQVTLATKIKRINTNFEGVRNWTRKIDLFDKDYIVFPINEDIHWYLAIIVNPGAGIYSMITQKPVIAGQMSSDVDQPIAQGPYLIVLNSLIDPAVDKHIEVRSQLAEYLYLEYKDKYQSKTSINDDKYFAKDRLQVVVPTLVPQQKGFIDCGLFLLHFAELFLTNPPKVLTNNAPFHRWFRDFRICDKRDEIKDALRKLSPHVRPSDFIYYPQPNPANKSKRSKRQQQSVLEVFPLMGRDRKQSESRIYDIKRDTRFSVLYRPRSLDSLLDENKEKPLILQPPTISEMKRYRKMKI